MGKRSIMRWWTGGMLCSSLLVSVPVQAQSNELPANISIPTATTPDDIAGQVSTHFKRRWQNDPNFNQDLEYQIDLQTDGRVQQIAGLDNNSRIYLEKTQFLRVGDQLTAASDRNHVLWLVLGARGVVRVSLSPPPTAIIRPVPNIEAEKLVSNKIQKYFQQRWSAKNNIPDNLQYRAMIGANGRILSIEAMTELSRTYLKNSRFINVGDQVILPRRSSKLSTIKIWVIFNPNGEVMTLLDS
jgi:hypothetical protein